MKASVDPDSWLAPVAARVPEAPRMATSSLLGTVEPRAERQVALAAGGRIGARVVHSD